MNALALFAYLGVCAYGAVRVTRILALPRRHSPAAAFLIWFVLFFTLFQGGFHLLGFFDLAGERALIVPLNLLLVIAAIVGVTEWCVRRVYQPVAFLGHMEDRSHAALLPEFWRDGAPLAIAAGALLLGALLMLLQFPRDFEQLAYHLPVGLHVFQSRSLAVWDTIFIHTYTASASLFLGFMLQILPERALVLANIVFAAPLAVATYAIARTTGADRRACILVTAGLLTIPMVSFGLMESSAEVPGIALLAVAVYLVVASPIARGPAALLAGMAAGLAYGCKMFHIASIGYLFAVIALGFAGRRAGESGGGRLQLSGALFFALGVLVTAGFWMVRSYWLFHNPVYPVSIPVVSDLLGWAGPPGMGRRETPGPWAHDGADWLLLPWLERFRHGLGLAQGTGLGPFFAATVPIACVLVPVWALLGAAKEKSVLLTLWLGGLVVFAVWWVTLREPRYFMGAFVYLVPLAAWTISRCTGSARRAYDILVTVCVAFSLLVFLSMEAIRFGDRILFSKQYTRALYYEYPEVIDRLPAGSTVGVIGARSWHYRLLGAGLRNRIVSAPELIRTLELHGPNPSAFVLAQTPEVKIAVLPHDKMKSLGLTHLFVEGNTELRPGPCVSLEEIDRLDRNPVWNRPLPAPRRVFKVTLCADADSGGGKKPLESMPPHEAKHGPFPE